MQQNPTWLRAFSTSFISKIALCICGLIALTAGCETRNDTEYANLTAEVEELLARVEAKWNNVGDFRCNINGVFPHFDNGRPFNGCFFRKGGNQLVAYCFEGKNQPPWDPFQNSSFDGPGAVAIANEHYTALLHAQDRAYILDRLDMSSNRKGIDIAVPFIPYSLVGFGNPLRTVLTGGEWEFISFDANQECEGMPCDRLVGLTQGVIVELYFNKEGFGIQQIFRMKEDVQVGGMSLAAGDEFMKMTFVYGVLKPGLIDSATQEMKGVGSGTITVSGFEPLINFPASNLRLPYFGIHEPPHSNVDSSFWIYMTVVLGAIFLIGLWMSLKWGAFRTSN